MSEFCLEVANSADPDQTAPFGAVWSGSTMFVQAFIIGPNISGVWD